MGTIDKFFETSSSKRSEVFRWMRRVLRLIFLGPIAGLMAACGLRFIIISNPDRIGHLAGEVDCFLKERALGLIPHTNPVLLLRRKKAANTALLDLYKGQLTVWDRTWQRVLFSQFARFEMLRVPLGRPVVALKESAYHSQITALWNDRPPLVQLPDVFQADGSSKALQMGIPEDKWFVPLHVREGGYSPVDENMHAHRNADISTYALAIEEITSRGGLVIRMGDPTMTPVIPQYGLIDYANSSFKSDKMDIWLCANARFLIGTTSGLTNVTGMFNRPSALTNMVPLGGCYGMYPNDISIAKKMHNHNGESIPFAEIFNSGLARARYAWIFEEREIKVEANTPEEIRDLTMEMLAKHDGKFELTKEDEILQLRFRALLRPGDYSYGSVARMGRDWLRSYAHLI